MPDRSYPNVYWRGRPSGIHSEGNLPGDDSNIKRERRPWFTHQPVHCEQRPFMKPATGKEERRSKMAEIRVAVLAEFDQEQPELGPACGSAVPSARFGTWAPDTRQTDWGGEDLVESESDAAPLAGSNQAVGKSRCAGGRFRHDYRPLEWGLWGAMQQWMAVKAHHP